MSSFRKYLSLLLSCGAICAAAYGVRSAALSPLFLVRVVEVTEAGTPSRDAGPTREAPVSHQEIVDLAAVPVGRASLFELDLEAIEKRLLSHPWVRSVRLRKAFPETLAIEVTYRNPQAVFEGGGGALSYVDVDGKAFGKLSLVSAHDLPVLSGFNDHRSERVVKALSLLREWEDAPAARFTQLSSLSYEPERGFRGLVVYPLRKKDGEPGLARTMLDFGQDFDASFPSQLNRISQVLRYLSDNAIPARQIWADSGKKIVVKTARGS